ncbi:MAG: oligosaccharide flippase family protein [Candidatus Cloacimonas sp.]
MSDLPKQAGILSATEFFRLGIKTLIGIALARLITPKDLGSYRQLFLIYTTFSTLLLLGIPQSMLFFLPKTMNAEKQRILITRSLNLISVLGLLFALCLFIFRSMIARLFHNPQLENLLIIYAIYPLFLFVTQLYSSIMMGLKQPLRAAKFTIFAVLADLFLIVSAAFFTRNLTIIIWAVIVSAFLQWLYAQITLSKFKEKKVRFDFTFVKEQMNYALPLGLSSIIGMLSIQLDKFMISSFFTPEKFAIFSLGATEFPIVGILANSINSVLLPHLSSTNTTTMGELYSGAVRKNAILVFPLMALCYIFADPIIIFLYGKIYAEAAVYFRIYLFLMPLRIATFGILFQAFGKTKFIMYNSLFMLIANAVLNYILIINLGMKGAAIATVIVTWLSVIIYLIQIAKVLKLKLLDFFPLKKIARTAFVTIISLFLSFLIIWLGKQNLLFVAIGGIVFILSYLLLGRITGVILDYDIQLAQELIYDLKGKFKK